MNDEDDLVIRGLRCRSEGDLAAAEQAFRDADDLGSMAGTVMLGLLLRDLGQPGRAIETMRRAGVRGQKIIDALSQSGALALPNPGDGTEEILELGRRMAEESENHFLENHPQIDLGLTVAEEGDWRGAMDYLREECGQDVAAAWAIGRILEESDEKMAALDSYRSASAGGDPNGAFRAGLLLFAVDDQSAAREELARSRDLGHTGAAALLGSIDRMLEEQASLTNGPDPSDPTDPESARGWL